MTELQEQAPDALDLEFATLRPDGEDKETFRRRMGPTGFGGPLPPHVDSVVDHIGVTAVGGILSGVGGGIIDLVLHSGFRIASIGESDPAQIILAAVPLVFAAAGAGVAFAAEWEHVAKQRVILDEHLRGSQRLS